MSAAPCIINGPGTAPAAVLLNSLSPYLSLLKCFHQHRPKNLLFSQLEKTFFLFSSHPYSRSFALQICDQESSLANSEVNLRALGFCLPSVFQQLLCLVTFSYPLLVVILLPSLYPPYLRKDMKIFLTIFFSNAKL